MAGCSTAIPQTNTVPAPTQWIVRSWQTKDGLPQNAVYSLIQTRDGFLWLGTGGGVARFDGERFRIFGLEEGLLSVETSCLAEDLDGVLWAGTHGGGLSCWSNGQFVTYTQSNGFPAATVGALAGDRDGGLWIGTAQGLINYRKGTFRKIGLAEGLPQRDVRALMQDSKGVLWVGVPFDGIFRLLNGHFVRLPGPEPHPDGAYSLFEDNLGNIWAGGIGCVWRLHAGKWERYGSTNGLPAASFETFAQLKGSGLWVGARHAGIYAFNGEGFDRVPIGAADHDVRTILTARDGSVWVGSECDGLDRVLPRILQTWAEANGLPAMVRSVAENGDCTFWVATQTGGIYSYECGEFSKVVDPAMVKTPVCYSSLATHDGSVWVAGESFLYRFRQGRPTKAYVHGPIRREAIRAMCEDGNSVWLGTYSGHLLQVAGDSIVVATTNSFSGEVITSLSRAATDTLWVGTSGGLYQWQRGRVRRFGTADGLISSSIRCLYREPNGTLWIGTLGGGLSWLKDGRIVNVTCRQGLADDIISQIVEDDFGHLWLGSNHGIMRLDKSELLEFAEHKVSSVHAVLLGLNEGMLKEQCIGGQSPTAIKAKCGNLFFPTVGGLVEIDPERWFDSSRTPPLATIDEVRIDGKPQSGSSKVVVPPGRGLLEISFAAPNLRGNEVTRFRFQLEPFDKGWSRSGSRRTAYYPGLPPGDYVFKVSAGNERGKWNSNAASLAITVQPRLWQTWWFRSLAVAAFSALAFGIYLRRLAELKAKNAAQEEFTHELIRYQEHERKRVASELHDGLGQDLLLIKNRVTLLASDTRHATPIARELSEISTHTSRALADVRAISHALRPSAIEQVGFTKAVEWMVEQIAETSTTRFSTELENTDGLLAPEMEINMYRIVQEALNNVMKHAGASEVIVGIKRDQDGILISVHDNGKGFDVDGLELPDFGLAGMRERAKVLGGSVELRSSPGKGTRVTLHVPLNHNGK
jgi:signal transduction histidine kinase/ligand-binding sensor domain-containing protein